MVSITQLSDSAKITVDLTQSSFKYDCVLHEYLISSMHSFLLFLFLRNWMRCLLYVETVVTSSYLNKQWTSLSALRREQDAALGLGVDIFMLQLNHWYNLSIAVHGAPIYITCHVDMREKKEGEGRGE